MARKRRKGMNPHQKAVYREGERRAGREQVAELLAKSRSADADDRREAAENLCPCHVRRHIPEVWEALYRMLEDPEVRVRRAAWHTLEDGGRPDDPALDAVLERTLEREADPQVLRFARQVAGPRREREAHLLRAQALYRPERGKCDFCGAEDVPVERDHATEIPQGDHYRPARSCARCR
ncbi:MAG TPA: HEAT repeat domain-containing protein [Armatimonadaceae bacterium]|nr:HEAT repeat domain-containing protein [Armatimonadaceae bacterium]